MSDAVLDDVLARLADGELLAEVAEALGLKRTTLYMRLQATPELVDAYARAREEGLHARGERLRAIAGEQVERTANGSIDAAAVAQLKLRVDVEKWTLAKLLPKIYGDKLTQEHTGANGGPIQQTTVTMTAEEAYKRMLNGG